MRPNTLAEAIDRIGRGESREKALGEFLDHFYGLTDEPSRYEALRPEPEIADDVRLNALAGAIAEYLAKRSRTDVPEWVSAASSTLRDPWFTTDRPGPGINEYLWHSSPAEFRSRNIFTEGLPLRRASQRSADG